MPVGRRRVIVYYAHDGESWNVEKYAEWLAKSRQNSRYLYELGKAKRALTGKR